MEDDLITSYLQYTSDTEVPARFSRWCAIVGIGALLGRQYYIPFGHGKVIPNLYTMLIGSPGTRKGTAVKLITKILKQAGYNKFAAERTSKEKFLLDLAGEASEDGGDQIVEDILSRNLFGTEDGSEYLPDAECAIFLDEFNDFIGNGNIEFISMLGNLWTWEGLYTNRIKSGKSVSIHNPTISIIGGNTPTSFKNCFPVEMIGQGFLSRLVLIYGEPNGKRITFPPTPSADSTARIVDHFRAVKSKVFGPAKLTGEAKDLLDRIYKSDFGVDDVRFDSYANRRFDQLLKLCLIVSASRVSTTITECDVLHAHTTLLHVERFMPKALGEFGRAKNSDATHKVMEVINSAEGIVSAKEIWKHVHNDLEDMRKLSEILINLQEADKIQMIPAKDGRKGGILPKKKVVQADVSWAVQFDKYLTPEENEMRV